MMDPDFFGTAAQFDELSLHSGAENKYQVPVFEKAVVQAVPSLPGSSGNVISVKRRHDFSPDNPHIAQQNYEISVTAEMGMYDVEFPERYICVRRCPVQSSVSEVTFLPNFLMFKVRRAIRGFLKNRLINNRNPFRYLTTMFREFQFRYPSDKRF
jgi:hypothetical protein